MDYKRIEESDSPIPVKDWLRANRSHDKHTVLEVADKIYIVISRGEKRTGGYDILVKNIEEKDTEIHITFQYQDPHPDSIVMQVISYPFLILELEKVEKSIIFHILR